MPTDDDLVTNVDASSSGIEALPIGVRVLSIVAMDYLSDG